MNTAICAMYFDFGVCDNKECPLLHLGYFSYWRKVVTTNLDIQFMMCERKDCQETGCRRLHSYMDDREYLTNNQISSIEEELANKWSFDDRKVVLATEKEKKERYTANEMKDIHKKIRQVVHVVGLDNLKVLARITEGENWASMIHDENLFRNVREYVNFLVDRYLTLPAEEHPQKKKRIEE